MECEICGEKSSTLYEVIFQGKRVFACPKCIKKYNLPLVKKRSSPDKRRMYKPIKRKSELITESDEEVIEDYGKIIKKAREQLGLTQEDLARELKVKLSYIKKIESGKIEPSIDIARKLEKLLGVKLTSKIKADELYNTSEIPNESYLTLGDLLNFKEEESE